MEFGKKQARVISSKRFKIASIILYEEKTMFLTLGHMLE